MNVAVSGFEATAHDEHPTRFTIAVAGETLICDAGGCLFWPAENTLIVSDMHLEKGSSHARRGMLLPPYDTSATLAALAVCVALWRPARIISLGDSFHDDEGHERLHLQAREVLDTLMRGREWIWISGNHDPQAPDGLGGTPAREVQIRNLVFRHEPQGGPQPGEVAGHLHPKAKIIRRGRAVRRPCFATDGARAIMPAFGAYTGGLNIRHQAFNGLFEESRLTAIMLGNNRLYRIAAGHLAP